MTNRSQLIDIAKGIGILLVVFGHNPIVLNQKGEIFNIIFSFHMPLFFFLSGLFFNPKKSFKKIFTEKFDSLLKPYFVTLLSIGIVNAIFRNDNFIYYTLKMLYGNGSTIKWVSLWFLTHLFIVIIFSWFLIKILGEKLKTIQSKIIFLISLLLLGIETINYFWQFKVNLFGNTYILPGLPFSFDIVLITTFYYLLGHFSSQYILTFKPLFSALLVSIFLFISCHYAFNKTIDLNLRIFDGFVIPTVESLCGIYIVLALSHYVQRNRVAAEVLSALGVSSLFILIFHPFFQAKTLIFASGFIGEKNTFTLLFAFLSGSFLPALMYYLLKKNDYLSIFYMPLKTNQTFNRTRQISPLMSAIKPNLDAAQQKND